MTKSQQWSFYLSCSLFFLLLVSIMAFGEDESIEGDSESKRISMRFKDASLDHILEFISEAAGYTIVKSADLDMRVTIISPDDIPLDEAFSVLNTTLAIKGYTSIVNGRSMKIVPLSEAKLEATPIQVGSDPAAMKSDDTITTQVMPLSSADAKQLVKDLKDYVPKYGVMTAYGQTNTLIITASSANIKRLAEVVKQLDISMADRIKIEVFSLQYADAAKLAEVITKLYEKPKDTETAAVQERQQRRRRGGFGDRGQFGTGESPPNEDTLKQGGALQLLGEVKAVADENTNSLIVSASQPNLAVIRNLVSELDTQRNSEPETRVFSLEFGDASEIASELNLAFSSAARDVFTGGGFGGFGGFGGRSISTGALGSSAQSADAARGLTGNVKIVADEETNALLITTFVRNFPAVEKLVKQLDVLLPQVLIEAQIIEVTFDDESAFGVEWMWEQGTTYSDKTYQQQGANNFGLSEEIFGLKYGILSGKLNSMLHALTKNTKVNILSTPRIMTRNNQEAIINVGQAVPFLVSTQETATGGILTIRISEMLASS